MSIEIGSKWVKNEEVVEVFYTGEILLLNADIKTFMGGIVIFYSKENNTIMRILTEIDFLEQYKPCEPVYEWQWAYITNSLLRWHISNYMTEEEFKTWQGSANSSLEYKRLDFTKENANENRRWLHKKNLFKVKKGKEKP